MEPTRPTARHRLFVRLAERLATAQDIADSGSFATAFGYLEEAVKIALSQLDVQEVTRGDDVRDEAEEERLLSFDCADVWRGVESHPLFPTEEAKRQMVPMWPDGDSLDPADY